jgi:hypothetical protein
VKRDPLVVFVNAPFDPAYAPLFEALVFTLFACGYRVSCALEENDSGDIRLDKLAQLIAKSPRSIHDLSRIERGDNDLPRFNMPFELGMAMGARRFGGRSHKSDKIKIMVRERYKLPEYLSDLGGNDPDAHHGDPHKVIRIARDVLHASPHGQLLAGPAKLITTFDQFTAALPDIARGAQHEPNEIGGFKNYPTFVWCVAEFLKRA